MATLVQNSGRRNVILALLLGLLVAGTAFLVHAQVAGKERTGDSEQLAYDAGGWSRVGEPAASMRRLGILRPDALAVPAAAGGSSGESVPTPVRRLAPTPPPAPLPTPDGTPRRGVIPILMYHHIGVPGPGADTIRRDLSVSPDNFEAQLRYLIEHGYQPITLDLLIMHLQLGRALPPKPVVLTFDDGFKDQYSNAYPLLKKYGLVGTFFVITLFADEERPEYMSWPEIEFLHSNGMEIGSHSYTHPSLSGKSYDYVVWQVLGSREAIEARTGEPVRFFSYPSGQYDKLTVDVLRSAGYWGAVTVEAGSLQTAESPFELKRIRVRGRYDVREFDHWFNYWLAHP